MRYLLAALVCLLPLAAPAAEFPKFKAQEIDTGLKIGYAVVTADVDGDKKPDIVVVDQHKVVWYQNPGKAGEKWTKHVMLDGKTRPDNVCIAPIDIDGDGLPEFVVGAAWKPFDTAAAAAQLVWLKRGKDVTAEWSMYELPCDEPTVHRVRAFDIDGDGKDEIVHVPLMGRGSSAKGLWVDGKPVRIVALRAPAKEPEKKENWKTFVLSEELNVTHNFHMMTSRGTGNHTPWMVVTSYDGVHMLTGPNQIPGKDDGPWEAKKIGEGNQLNPKSNRGASEIKMGHVGLRTRVVATIEPWHGNQVVTYTRPPDGKGLWERRVIDEQLRWGHAVWFADLDGDRGGEPELIIGVRDDPAKGDTFKERRGVRIYKCTDGKGEKWERNIIEDGGVAVEDLTAADLDGDGKIDIIAVGRATGNCRIYWNQGK